MADAISEVQKIPLLDQAVLSAGLEEEPHSISAVTLQLLGTCSQHRTKEGRGARSNMNSCPSSTALGDRKQQQGAAY